MCTEIPIWVSGKQLWVTGVDKRTTVNDVIETLLGHRDKEYSLVERWCQRGVERQLNGETRLLKLWKTWGEDWKDVKLSLRKVPVDNDSGRSSPTNSSYSCRRRRHRRDTGSGGSCKYGQTIHPRRLSQLSKTQNIERLLKLILLQGETIQNQILKLKDKERQIEYIESEQHRNRIKSLGCNYLLETYLGGGDGGGDGTGGGGSGGGSEIGSDCQTAIKPDRDDDAEEEKEDSGVITECTPSSEYNSTPTGEDSKDEEVTIEEDFESEMKQLRDKIRTLEKVAKINKKIEREEENLVRLYINIERCRKNDKLIGDLTLSLEQLKNESEQSELQLRNNTALLTDTENLLNSRKFHLAELQNQLENDDQLINRMVICGRTAADSRHPFLENDFPDRPINGDGYNYNKQFYSASNCTSKPMLDTLV